VTDANGQEDAPRAVVHPLAFDRWMAALKGHPSGLLLAAQLAGVLLYPLMENTDAGRAVFGALGIVVLALALWVINRSPTVNWIAWCIALPSVVLSLLGHVGGHEGLLPAAQLLESVLYFYAAAGLIAYMLSDHRVTLDELLAAGATFTLLAWAFAFAFQVCQGWYPGSFTAATNTADPRSWMELLFLSFSLLSSVGLSDIVPITAPARALAMIEMFGGVMYIAVVVSRLIALATLRMQRD
jgi:Ion channel